MSEERKGPLGCISFMTRQVVITVLGIILALLTVANVYAGGQLFADETCEIAHPFLFQIQSSYFFQEEGSLYVEYINESFFQENIEFTIEDLRREDFETEEEYQFAIQLFDAFEAKPIPSGSCIGDYGFENPETNSFQFSQAGYDEFAGWYVQYSEDDPEGFANSQLISEIQVTPIGRFWLYFLMPAYLILLPIITIRLSKREWGLWWYVMVTEVAFLAITSALLYINFAEVTGIEALSDFGTGVFGGVITGTALAFMGHLVEIFGEDKPGKDKT